MPSHLVLTYDLTRISGRYLLRRLALRVAVLRVVLAVTAREAGREARFPPNITDVGLKLRCGILRLTNAAKEDLEFAAGEN